MKENKNIQYTILSESQDFQVDSQILQIQKPGERNDGGSIAQFIMIHKPTGMQKFLDLQFFQSSEPHFDFSWTGPGKISWDRQWVFKIINSGILGSRPVNEMNNIKFDFYNDSHSILFGNLDHNSSLEYFSYTQLDFIFTFDLNLRKLFIQKS